MPYAVIPPGATIGVIAPAGPAKPEQVAKVAPLIESSGWRAKLFPSCHQHVHPYLAGPDELRAADIHAAFADPEVHSIWCLRGGYGCSRLLRQLDGPLIRHHPKLLIGYSDITVLHAWLWHQGLPGLHAPMPASDLLKPGREPDRDALLALLRGGLRAGTSLQPNLQPSRLRMPGVAEGLLVGGNLSLVASITGTPWAWPKEGVIVFLEDVSEDLYRTDRYFSQLQGAGVLDAAEGFLIGSFTEQDPPDEVLEHYLKPLGKPVLAGWPTGHGTPNRPLPMGVRVRLDADAGVVTVLDDLIV